MVSPLLKMHLEGAIIGFNLTVVEPYHTCPLEDGLESGGTFSPSSMQIAQVIMNQKQRTQDERFTHLPYFYSTAATDGVFSLGISCSQPLPSGSYGYEVISFDHTTRDLKVLGTIPKYDMDEQIFGSLTANRRFAAVVIYSEGLSKATTSLIDISNGSCLLQKDCRKEDFPSFALRDIAIKTQDVIHGRYRIAMLSEELKLFLWEPTTLAQRSTPLRGVVPMHRFGSIFHKTGYLKFTPDGRFLCLLCLVVPGRGRSGVCLLMDPALLVPLYILPLVDDEYNAFIGRFSGHFCPIFSTCSTKLVLYEALSLSFFQFFEIPSRQVQTLQELCRYSILTAVFQASKLKQLPLPDSLIEYLSDCGPVGGSPLALFTTPRSKKVKTCNIL